MNNSNENENNEIGPIEPEISDLLRYEFVLAMVSARRFLEKALQTVEAGADLNGNDQDAPFYIGAATDALAAINHALPATRPASTPDATEPTEPAALPSVPLCKLWQGFAGAPDSAFGWRLQLATYLAARWHDSKHPLAGQNPQWRGPDAFAPELKPLVEACDNGAPFELSEPLTWMLFSEYLSEYPQRRQLWDAFEAKAGPVEVL